MSEIRYEKDYEEAYKRDIENSRYIFRLIDCFNSEDAAVNSVSSIYSIMLSDAFTGHDDATYDACSDDIYNNGDHYDFDIPINRFTCTPTEGLLPNYQWQTKYEMISRANLVIINIPKMSSDIISLILIYKLLLKE